MELTTKPASKAKIVLLWFVLLANIVISFWLAYHFSSGGRQTNAEQAGPTGVAHFIVMLFAGGFFLVSGIVGYFVALLTNGLTFSFHQPVWKGLKVRFYFVNLIVFLLISMGIGFIASAFTFPILSRVGLSSAMANMLPVVLAIVLVQVLQLFIFFWSPITRSVIVKRLTALGLTSAQMQSGRLIGISDPTRSSFKKFGAVEEDIGELWVGPEQVIFWGDQEQFGVAREQVAQIERKADAGSTSMMGGLTHVVLHVRLPDGNVRQIRFHIEGVWTSAERRRGMDMLAESIVAWHSAALAAPAQQV